MDQQELRRGEARIALGVEDACRRAACVHVVAHVFTARFAARTQHQQFAGVERAPALQQQASLGIEHGHEVEVVVVQFGVVEVLLQVAFHRAARLGDRVALVPPAVTAQQLRGLLDVVEQDLLCLAGRVLEVLFVLLVETAQQQVVRQELDDQKGHYQQRRKE